MRSVAIKMRRIIGGLAMVLAACGATSGLNPGDANTLFEIREVAIPAAEHQTVLAGSFDGTDRAQLAIVSAGATGKRHVRLIALEDREWRTSLDAVLEPAVLFVDVARVGGRDRLLIYRHGSVDWFDPYAAEQRPLINLKTSYRSSADDGIPHLDITHDVNGDGRDDLLIPDIDGFWLALQSRDGEFGQAVKLGPADPFADRNAYGDKRTYRQVGITAENTPWYLSRVHRLDYDRDGRQDLMFWNRYHFLLYRQNARGDFADPPRTLEAGIEFDFDGSYGLAFQFGDASVPSMLLGMGPRTHYTVLQGFRDLNGDGVADAVTLSLTGRSPFRLRGRYDVRFGRPAPDATFFPEAADTSFKAPGRSGGLQAWGYAAQKFLDLNGDGAADAAVGAVNIGLSGMFGALAGNSIAIDLALYQLRDGEYPAEPDWERRVSSPFSPLNRRGPLFPTILTGEINGDGRSDLLVGERWDELSVFLGVPGKEPLASQAITLNVAIPRDERHARIADLDNDGTDDVFIQHSSATEPGRLVILMAN